ncbi:hypothetical protein SDC9_172009 [bioreactor metagenome]|uniref:Uncharacterized protein n=1 Tax=bioreactor metagenome TaxID=1076179 RepID=A0A645GCG9_9ZZZZ
MPIGVVDVFKIVNVKYHDAGADAVFAKRFVFSAEGGNAVFSAVGVGQGIFVQLRLQLGLGMAHIQFFNQHNQQIAQYQHRDKQQCKNRREA